MNFPFNTFRRGGLKGNFKLPQRNYVEATIVDNDVTVSAAPVVFVAYKKNLLRH